MKNMNLNQKVFLVAGVLLFSQIGFCQSWNASVAEETGTWIDEAGQSITLSQFANRPLVVAMAYTQCRKTCPLLTLKKLREIETALQSQSKSAEFVVVTLDPENDTSSVLARYKKRWNVDRPNWHLVHGDLAATHRLAEKFGFGKFWNMKEHSGEDDHIQHDFRITYFDPSAKSVKTLDWNNRDVKSLF